MGGRKNQDDDPSSKALLSVRAPRSRLDNQLLNGHQSKYIFLNFVSVIFGPFVTKLGPGSVEIVFGIVFSSNLVGSNLDFIDSNAHSRPFSVPEIWTKTIKM